MLPLSLESAFIIYKSYKKDQESQQFYFLHDVKYVGWLQIRLLQSRTQYRLAFCSVPLGFLKPVRNVNG